MSVPRWVAGLFLAVLPLVGFVPSVGTAIATNGRIAFARAGPEILPEIYVMNADGSSQKNLTRNLASDASPAWSPDGKKIAFYSDRDLISRNFEIYVMNADGSDQTRLTTSSAPDFSPAWSPNGKKIAFQSARDGNYEIYVMNADGSDQTRLTVNPATDSRPAWSPDGRTIAFDSQRAGKSDIYLMNADGSNQTRLTTSSAPDSSPAWSPDGRKIAFASNRDIYVMNADGSRQTRLTAPVSPQFDDHPAWSPDGKRIAFDSNREGTFQIYVMNADGSGETRLTKNPSSNWPAWQPSTASADTQPPSAPPRLFKRSVTKTTMLVSWPRAKDNVGVKGYIVYRNSTVVGKPSRTSFTLRGLTCATRYRVSVRAYDGAGNRSAKRSITASTSACG